MYSNQAGFTLVEWMIAATIGMVLLLGPGWFLAHASRSLERFHPEGMLYETARYSTEYLVEEIRASQWLGPYHQRAELEVSIEPGALQRDCISPGVGSRLSRQALATPVEVLSVDISGDTPMDCIEAFNGHSLLPGSQVLLLSSASQLLLDTQPEPDQIYFALDDSGLYMGATAWLAAQGAGWFYPFQSNLYYLQRKENGVPALYRVSLSGKQMIRETTELVEGVENLQVRRVFRNESGALSYQVSTEAGGLVGIELALLFRSLEPVHPAPLLQEFVYPSGLQQKFQDRYLRKLVVRMVPLH